MASAEHETSVSQLLTEAPESVVSFEQSGFTFDYFLSKHSSKTLLVFFPSALREGARRVPAFHRWTWAKDLPRFDVLCVSDPTMRLDERMLGGWLLGDSKTWILESVLGHVKFLQHEMQYENILFCGSSLGGFCAIQAAILAPSSGLQLGSGGFYSENPQINLMTYKHRAAIDLIANVCFDAAARESISQEYESRLNVVSTMKRYGHVPRGHLVIKESDEHHFGNQVPQLAAYVENFPESSIRIETIPSSLDATGHTPLDFNQMLERIELILSGKD